MHFLSVNKTFTLLDCCVSAPQFFAAAGTRTEENAQRPPNRSPSPGEGWGKEKAGRAGGEGCEHGSRELGECGREAWRRNWEGMAAGEGSLGASVLVRAGLWVQTEQGEGLRNKTPTETPY